MTQHSHGHVIRNIIGLLITQLGTWTVTLVLTLVLPRYLGVQFYGIYAFVFSFTGLVGIGMNLGMGTYLTWRIARHPEEAGKLTFNALLIQLPLALIFCCAVILIVPLIDHTILTIHLAMIAAVSSAGAALVSTCASGLAGLQHLRAPAFIGLGCSVVGTAGIVVAIHLQESIVVLAACGLGAQALNLALMLAYTQAKLRLLGRIDFRLWPKIIAGGMPFFAWSVVLLFYGQVDITLTKILTSDTVVGWYAAANRIVSIPIFIPTIVVTAILPALSHEREPSSPRFRELVSHSVRMVMVVGIPAAAGTVLLATHLIALLHYPRSFSQIVPLMVILGINLPLVGLDMVLGTVLISIGRQKAWTGVGIVSAFFNPLANLWAIPFTQHMFGDGAIGAAAVTLATEFIMMVGALALLPRRLFTWSDAGYIFRCLVAAALMVPAVRGLVGYGTISIALAISYGFVVYTLAAYALRLITNDDVRGVAQAVQARLGTSGALFDHRTVAGNALRVLASAQIAAGRLKSISRPLVSGAAQMMGAVSQPVSSAARQTALRMGGAISRPLGALARSAGIAPGDGSLAPAITDTDSRGVPPWGMPKITTAPLPPLITTAPLPSLAEVQARRLEEAVALHDGDNGGDIEAHTTRPVMPNTVPSQWRSHPSHWTPEAPEPWPVRPRQ